jgi:ornithine cyclodeaminase
VRYIDKEEVVRRLPYEVCIPAVREAMIALSKGETLQRLRSVLPLSEDRLFGVMFGALGARAPFGAKVISVFPSDHTQGGGSHQGVVVLFDPVSGAPALLVHAGEITAIRTGAASAVATDALARPDARRLAVLGCGEQAVSHVRAIARVRILSRITLWGRSQVRAAALAGRLEEELDLPVESCATGEATVCDADIICAVTGAREPVLNGAWVRPGAHVNLVGSGMAGPREADDDLVLRSRFIADHREGVLAQGAEFLHAKAAGLVGDDHVVGEIGQVLAGVLPGRRSPDEITLYKSLGHIVQDLAAALALQAQLAASGQAA